MRGITFVLSGLENWNNLLNFYTFYTFHKFSTAVIQSLPLYSFSNAFLINIRRNEY